MVLLKSPDARNFPSGLKLTETLWAPLLLSGSAVTLLVEEALGGLLAGRVVTRTLRPLTREHTLDLVFRYKSSFGMPAAGWCVVQHT